MDTGWNISARTIARRWLAAVLCFALLLAGEAHIAAASPALGQDYQIQTDANDHSSAPCSQGAKLSHTCCVGSAGCAFATILSDPYDPIVPSGQLIGERNLGLPAGLPTAPPSRPPKLSLSV
jgi:hypothetical protein